MSWSLAVIVVTYGLSVFAQSVPSVVAADKVWIQFKAGCKVPTNPIFVVLDGKEDEAFPVTHQGNPYVWTGYWLSRDKEHQTFTANAGKRTASLRLEGARTECRPSGKPIKPEGEWMATFVFACPDSTVHDIHVEWAPKRMPISYVRRMPKTVAESVDCVELGKYQAPIKDVLKGTEEVRLQLGEAEPTTKNPGVLLDTDVLKKLAKTNGPALHLDGTTLAKALELLRGRGTGGVPTLSGIAIDIDNATLKRLGFESLDLTVTP